MKLHKSRSDRMIFGVCGGIAESLGINSMIVRVVFVLAAMMTRSIVFWIYLLLGFVLPYSTAGDDGSTHNPFGDSFGGFGGETRTNTGYRPDEPPFDISDAKDVEIDSKEEK